MQNDLISRSALDVDLQNLVREYNRNCESDKSAGAFEALYHLRLAPAIDAVPVVYCRECRRWRVGLDRTNTWCALLNGMETVEPDYCSFGKRRADDG